MTNWKEFNERRITLIYKKHQQGITEDERAELENLQRLADVRIVATASLPAAALETVKAQLMERGIWEAA